MLDPHKVVLEWSKTTGAVGIRGGGKRENGLTFMDEVFHHLYYQVLRDVASRER